MEEVGSGGVKYVVEHFEEEISQWTLCEYTHMIMTLSDLYNEGNPNSKVILTNFKFKGLLNQGKLDEDEYGTLKNMNQLLKINENLGYKCLMSRLNLLELTTKENIDKVLENQEEYKDDDTYEIATLFSVGMKVKASSSESNICFMDMRGESELKPEDSKQFEFLIFGGILGDHPPQDRGKELRSNFANVRQLGTI